MQSPDGLRAFFYQTKKLKRIYFTVTNDLTYDQRMHRICQSLAANGYAVTLVGRKLPSSLPLTEKAFTQKRLRCWFTRGKKFYIEYNIRLLLFLLFRKMDAICAIDLDTIMPCLTISRLKRIPRIYDAHELFTELKEVVTRPAIQKAWTRVEKRAVPRFKMGYTVSRGIAAEFERRYHVKYETIRNVPVLTDATKRSDEAGRFILYQGAVNEARGFEYLLPAMKKIDCKLVICGDGNFMPQLKKLIAEHQLEQKIELRGMLPPEELAGISRQAYLGIALAEKEGLNQYLALPNKFFDYIHAGLPQVTMNFPEYQAINREYEVAVLIDDLAPDRVAAVVNNLLNDVVLYNRLRENCLKARLHYNWQEEEKKLLAFYQSVFNS